MVLIKLCVVHWENFWKSLDKPNIFLTTLLEQFLFFGKKIFKLFNQMGLMNIRLHSYLPDFNCLGIATKEHY